MIFALRILSAAFGVKLIVELPPSSLLHILAFHWNGPLSYGRNLISRFSMKILLFHFDHKWVMIGVHEREKG